MARLKKALSVFNTSNFNFDAVKKVDVPPAVSDLFAAATAPSASFDSLFAAASKTLAALPAPIQPTPVQVESFKEAAKVAYDTYLPVVKNALSNVDLSDGISGAELKALRTSLSSDFDFLL
jgi:hypothetical protein